MTRDDIIRMAEDAGFIWETEHPAIVALAQLAYAAGAAAEREACAQVCESYDDDSGAGEAWAFRFAQFIRARGEK